MIKEYGVDPLAINSQETFSIITPHFGKEFRYIRRYPPKWPSLVKNAINDLTPVAKLKIIERLKQMDKFLIKCDPKIYNLNSYDGNKTWIENAVEYHEKSAFDGIITKDTDHNDSYIINSGEFDIEQDIFDTSELYKVERTALKMANRVKHLLYHANEIHFVDPLMENFKPRHLRPLKKFIEIIKTRNDDLSFVKIIYHMGDSSTEGNIRFFANRDIRPHLIPNLKIHIIRHSSSAMHNRYILTDIGGVDFLIGLDDDDNGHNDKHVDDVDPISEIVCRKRACNGRYFMDPTLPIFYTVQI